MRRPDDRIEARDLTLRDSDEHEGQRGDGNEVKTR